MIRIGEKSFTAADVPDNFYLVTQYPDSLSLDDLQSGEIEGVTGISDTGLILIHFFAMARNVVLKLDGRSTVEQNRLTRVMYDNPHYLVSRNLYALSRIYQKESQWRQGKYDMIMSNFFEILAKELQITHVAVSDFINAGSRVVRDMKPRNIDNAYDFVEYIQRLFAAADNRRFQSMISDLDEKEIEHAVFSALETIGQIYQSEGEWIIKDKKLKLPPNDGIAVIMSVPSFYEDWKADTLEQEDIQRIFLNRLDKRLEDMKALEDFCNSRGIAFYAIEREDFETLRERLFSLEDSEKLNRLTKEYRFL